MKRRDFLKLLFASFGSLAGLKIFENLAVAGPYSSSQEQAGKWGMVIDQSKCNGCEYCIKACQASNDIHPELAWIRVHNSSKVGGQAVFTPVSCQHCENAPCVSVCPVGASYHREDGIVMTDYKRCIGCRYCLMACPYGARTFNWESFDETNVNVPEWGEPDVERRPRGVAEKCTFCVQRIDRGLEIGLTPGIDKAATPACVNACPTGARIFGDLTDPESQVSQVLKQTPSVRLLEHMGTNSKVYYLPPTSMNEEIKT